MYLVLLVISLCCLLHGAYSRSVITDRSLAACDARSFTALQPATTKSPIVDLRWIDKNDLRVLGLTRKVSASPTGGLWLSKDGGKSWAEKTAELASSTGSAEPFEIVDIIVQKSNPANVVILGSGTYMWTSTDYGATLTPKKNPNSFKGSAIKSIRLHPWHDDHMLMLVKRPYCKVIDTSVQECPYDLMMTSDLFSGLTWTNLTAESGKVGGFVDMDWSANLCPHGKEGCKIQEHLYRDDTIFATLYVHEGDYDEAWDPDVHFVMSDNFFKDYNILVKCGNMFEIMAGGVYLAWSNKCDDTPDHQKNKNAVNFPTGITLYTSVTGGHDFIRACLPVALKQEGYELLETHDGSGAIIIVDYSISSMMMDIPSSSVYTAGPHQALFSLSMNDLNHANYGYSMDFARIEGLPGVYIANQMSSRMDQSYMDNYYSYDYYGTPEFFSAPLVETQITYNGGGRWQRIMAPKSFTYPKCNRCEGNSVCYLHLNGLAEWNSLTSMPSVYSSTSAPGVIMGVGNVGAQGTGLGDNDGTCTWMSVDGGVTWKDVADQAMIYEFADFGSTVVMAPYGGMTGKPTAEVLFSLDGGNCWQKVPLTTALLVENIRIEPDGQRPRVIVHGSACRQPDHAQCSYTAGDTNSQVQGLMYVLDITELMPGMMGMCSPGDYEQWGVPTSPEDKTVRCILGQQSTMQRKRVDRMCLNGPDFVRPLPTNVTCSCKQELDLECDYGYLKAGTSVKGQTTCLKLPDDRMPECPELNKGQYMVSGSGYRTIHADVCEGAVTIINDTDGKGSPTNGWNHDHGNGKKSGSRKHGPVFHFFIFILVCVLLAGAFLAWWRFVATEAHRDTVRDLAGGVASFCTSLYLWVSEKIRGRSDAASMDHDLGYFQPLGEVPEHEAGVFTIK